MNHEVKNIPDVRVFHRGFDYGNGPAEQVMRKYEAKPKSAQDIIKYGLDLISEIEEEAEYAA